MEAVALAWLVATVLLTIVLLAAWRITGSFFKAWLVMLMFGKVIAAVYYFAGLDRTVFTITFVNRQNPDVIRTISFTVAEILFVTFLFTLLSSIVAVMYLEILPKEFRFVKRMFEVERNER